MACSLQLSFHFYSIYRPQKMQPHECCRVTPHSPRSQPRVDYQAGFFGKATRQRQTQPSMYEILSWDEQPQPSSKGVCRCSCGYDKPGCDGQQEPRAGYAGPYQPEKYSHTKQREQSRSKDVENKVRDAGKEQQPRNSRASGRQQQDQKRTQHQIRSPEIQRKKVKEQARPQSAGATSKKTKATPHRATDANYMKGLMEPVQRQEQTEQNKQKLIEKFKQTTRWIPNSAFTTYFGKPAFENYGRGNTSPTYGGLMYGNYLKTHNVQPHRGLNSPKNVQSYQVALMKGAELGPIYPYPPKVSAKEASLPGNVPAGKALQSIQIYQEENNYESLPIYPPNLQQVEKFGGRGLHKVARSSKLDRHHTEKQNEAHRRGPYS